MNRYFTIALLSFGSLLQSAAAQPPAREPPKSPIRLLPNYVATDQPKDSPRRSDPRPGPVPPPLETPPTGMPPWEHLMVAAEHLEAAGLKNEADELRARARRQKHEERLSTEQLRRELDRLRTELDALQKQVANTQQIELRLTMIEFSEDRLREAGVELPAEFAAASRRGGVVEDPATLLRRIDELRAKDLVSILSKPTMRTLDACAATVQVGSPVSVASPSGERKTLCRDIRVDVVPHVLGGRKLYVEVRPSISDFSSEVAVDEGSVPPISTTALDTAVAMNAGETMVVGGMRTQRTEVAAPSDRSAQTETMQLFFLLTADLLSSGGSAESTAPLSTQE